MNDLYYYRDYAIVVRFEGDDERPFLGRYRCRKERQEKDGPPEIEGVILGYRDSAKDLHARAIKTAQSHIDQQLSD